MKNILATELVPSEHVASLHPEWDVHELLRRLDNDHTFLRELLAVYRHDSQTSLQGAKNALASQDLAALERTAHGLKGMMKNLLMNRTAQSASDLEVAARQGEAKQAAALLAQLEKAMEELLPEVDAQLAEVKA